MTTVFLGHHPEVDALLAQRRARGLDGRDEVRNGVYYVVPHAHVHHGIVQARLAARLDDTAESLGLVVVGEFNLGEPEDFRVPDLGLCRGAPSGLYVPTAALVVEILSPGERPFEKFAFYGDHGVDEILVVDLKRRAIRCWGLDPEIAGGPGPQVLSAPYCERDWTKVLGVDVAELAGRVQWP